MESKSPVIKPCSVFPVCKRITDWKIQNLHNTSAAYCVELTHMLLGWSQRCINLDLSGMKCFGMD